MSRSLYFYVKKQHVGVVPGVAEFAAEFASDEAWGDFGYLSEKGLIPLPEDDRVAMAERVSALDVMTGDEWSTEAEPEDVAAPSEDETDEGAGMSDDMADAEDDAGR